MYLYLIRHGIAIEQNDEIADTDRYLTKKGIAKTTRIAQHLAARVTFDFIFSSPLVRARQTADLLIKANLSDRAIETAIDLAPGGSLVDWIELWQGKFAKQELQHQAIALVGHAPDLSEWAEQLIFGRIEGKLMLKKAGIIELEFTTTEIAIGTAVLNALIPPRHLDK
jgi:phosphohistidine phosphatase